MSPLKISVIVAVLSALVTAGGLFKLHQARMLEARHLAARNSQMRLEAYQRNQTRIAAANPRAAAAAIAPGGTQTTKALTSQVKPMADYYRNEGNATPLATLQTFAWACDRGDVETVGRLLHIDPAARPKAEAFIASLPESVRGQWSTVDATIAALLTRQMMAQPFPNAEILETATVEQISADRVKLRMPSVPKDGTEYQQTAEGWKYVLTEKMVDAYIKQSRSPARP
jgi:hypothetical protein